MVWLPGDFVHATEVTLQDGYHLRPIRASDVELDLPAVMSSRERLWSTYGEAGADAEISWWVREEYVDSEVARALDAVVPGWIEREWPRRAPRYVGRALSWQDWLALP